MTAQPARKGAQALRLELAPLPYAYEALEPIISAETLRFHHDKHHQKYVDVANQLMEKDGAPGATLEEVVRSSQGKLFNNAAQVWNHDFYWKSLAPQGSQPGGALMDALKRDFGDFEAFQKKLAEAASGQFGSGWAWLVQNASKLEIVTTPNAETPMAKGLKCLLTVDVWEHAYYIDYRNDRDKYLKAVIGSRLNWNFANENFQR